VIPLARRNPCKNLASRRNRANQANWGAKKPFVFNEAPPQPANISKFILGGIWRNQRIAGEKIWKIDFSGFRARPTPPHNSPMTGHSMRQGFRRREIVSKKRKGGGPSKNDWETPGAESRASSSLAITRRSRPDDERRRQQALCRQGLILWNPDCLDVARRDRCGAAGDNTTRAIGRTKGEIGGRRRNS
jgi:hypothetical protein